MSAARSPTCEPVLDYPPSAWTAFYAEADCGIADVTDLTSLTLADALDGMEKKQFSSVELTDAFLGAIDKANPHLNAYVVVTPEKARARGEGERREARARAKRGRSKARRWGSRISSAPKACARRRAPSILGEFTPTYESTVSAQSLPRRRDDAGQAQHGRVRDGLVERDVALRPGGQSRGGAATKTRS